MIPTSISLLLLVSWLSPFPSSAQPDFRYSVCKNGIGNYTNGSAFAANLNTLLSNITQFNDGVIFYNLTAGQNSGVDRVNGLFLCRGDVTPSDCKSCVSNASRKIRAVCPNQKEAIGWYDNCMLRYSNRSIFGVPEESPGFAIFITANASDPDAYDDSVGKLLRQLGDKAKAGGSRRKFAIGSAKVTDFVSVYALVECTPDLSDFDCVSCIQGAMGSIQSCCYGKPAVFVGRPSCDVRFDSYQFYNSYNESSPPSASPPPPSPPLNGSTSTTGMGSKGGKLVVAVVFPTIISVVLVAILGWCFFWRKRWKGAQSFPSVYETKDDIQGNESSQFEFRTIRAATNNFSGANKLGQGGSGVVYKGMLSNGQEIAVKRLAKNSGQGGREFKTEVLLVAKLRHRNLVRLLGFCVEKEERLLVYEFSPNGSLDHCLFDPVKCGMLDWQTRYKIIMGVARGLLYLHEDSQLRIIHRDLKASNVLLDAEMDPKISDFGIARLFQVDQTQGDTNRVVGTYGYMAPEYALHGLFSAKSDVYSFGVLVLEIISGKRSIGMYQGDNSAGLISSVWRHWREGNVMNIVDPRISTRQRSEIKRCIHIGLLCVQEDVMDRPTMSSVVLMLSSHSFTLPVPSYPAYVTRTVDPLVRPSVGHRSQGTTSSESGRKSLRRNDERRAR